MPGKNSSFNKNRVLHISNDIGAPITGAPGSMGYNELRAFVEVAHELNHAMAYKKYVALGGNPDRYWRKFNRMGNPKRYAEEEMRVEKAAQGVMETVTNTKLEGLIGANRGQEASDLRWMLSEALADSDWYIEQYRRMLGQ